MRFPVRSFESIPQKSKCVKQKHISGARCMVRAGRAGLKPAPTGDGLCSVNLRLTFTVIMRDPTRSRVRRTPRNRRLKEGGKAWNGKKGLRGAVGAGLCCPPVLLGSRAPRRRRKRRLGSRASRPHPQGMRREDAGIAGVKAVRGQGTRSKTRAPCPYNGRTALTSRPWASRPHLQSSLPIKPAGRQTLAHGVSRGNTLPFHHEPPQEGGRKSDCISGRTPIGHQFRGLRAIDDMVNVVRERVSDVCRPPAGAYDVGTFLFHGLTPRG